jgi:hypothetical protein
VSDEVVAVMFVDVSAPAAIAVAPIASAPHAPASATNRITAGRRRGM